MKFLSHFLVVSSICFSANYAVRAHAAEAFPTYNYDLYCTDFSGGDMAKKLKCVEKEAVAFDELQQNWASYPEKLKVECYNVTYDANTGKGSYGGHLQCIKKGRK